jgi:hypothetical protein
MQFAHGLALKFGRIDVEAMLAEIPPWKLLRWYAYLQPPAETSEPQSDARMTPQEFGMYMRTVNG